MGSSTLGRSLEMARSEAFVGRVSERDLFAAALGSDDPPWSVLWFHGPGGVGKSSLLARLGADAEAVGADVAPIDVRSFVDRDSAGEALEEVMLTESSGTVARVVLIDSLDRVEPLEAVLRTVLLPALPGRVQVVVASRNPPGAEWRADPAWREPLRIVSLRNLSPVDADRYLQQFGIPSDQRPALVELSHGHPLALSLLADLSARGTVDLGAGLAGAPHTVAALLARIVEEVPSDEHRRLLEVVAVARVTTEALVRDALEVDRDRSRQLFEWLRSRPYVEIGSEGVSPHDLVRDLLDADLRWRDPDAYAAVFRRVRRHIHTRLEGLRGTPQRRAIADEKFVFRNLPSVLSPVDWSNWGHADPEPADAGDRDPVIRLVESFEGPESAAIATRWWDLQPDAFHVLRDPEGAVQGFAALINLTDVTVEQLAFDPVAVAAMAHTSHEAPLRPGDVVTQTRFVIDRDRYQAPSPTLNAVPVLTLQQYLQTPRLSWDFLALFEPDAMNDYFAIADLPRAELADSHVGGRRYGLFAHDFRRVPVRAWLEAVTDRALAQDPSPPATSAPEMVVLSHEAFTDAARHALRDLNRPDRLAANPLARSRIVQDRPGGAGQPGPALADLLHLAVDTLAGNPRDHKRLRALERTYLKPAASQERAAEALGLPFSTYRRHLTEGVERIVAYLWELEIHGPSGVSTD